MNKTKIEWVKNPDGTQGYTWNPITGCNNQIDGMCQGGNFPCYAYRLANGRLKDRYLANKNTATRNYDEDSYSFYPRFWEDRLQVMWDRIRSIEQGYTVKPRGMFVCDMSDLFGIGIPEEWTKDVMLAIRSNPLDRFYLLTKQPQNLIKFSPYPPNCYVGVTVTKPEFLLPTLDTLDSIQCSVRYLSIEPMLAAFNVPDLPLLLAGSVDWLILGSQTKPYKPPKIEWVEEIIQACRKANIPIFLKNNLLPIIQDRKLIQEMPIKIPLTT